MNRSEIITRRWLLGSTLVFGPLVQNFSFSELEESIRLKAEVSASLFEPRTIAVTVTHDSFLLQSEISLFKSFINSLKEMNLKRL